MVWCLFPISISFPYKTLTFNKTSDSCSTISESWRISR